MLKKPNPADFEISDKKVWHRPSDESFIPHPGKPADGVWKDGYSIAAADYDRMTCVRWGATCGPSTSAAKRGKSAKLTCVG